MNPVAAVAAVGGGRAGTGGEGGHGGGSAYAIFLWNNGAGGLIEDCSVIPGSRGSYGVGGSGGNGGGYGSGGTRGNAADDGYYGGYGGRGGYGGAGGAGGNGAYGVRYAVGLQGGSSPAFLGTMAGCSVNGDETFGSLPDLPPVPVNVAATDGDYNDKVAVSWTSVAEATSYQIYRSTTNDSATAGAPIGSSPIPSYEDSLSAAGVTYYYWVKSVGVGGTSDFSEPDSGFSALELIAGAGPNGSISPTGTVVVSYGGSTNFVITAEPYFHIEEVKTNDVSVGAVSGVLWSNIVAPGTIHATFAPDLATNNVPHWWLASFGYTNDFDQAALGNQDGDTLLTWEEYFQGTSPNDEDTDNDTVFDGMEVALADLGFVNGVSDTNLLALIQNYADVLGVFTSAELNAAIAQGEANVTNAPGSYGLYTPEALLDLGVGDIGLQVSNGVAELSVQLWQSEDLNIWTNAGGEVEWQLPVDAEKKFYRVRAEP
ncbi:hypothetical protein PDESU_04501 [Pontiella desulfatans]|uniref:Fibronectin type-III domain-containing protein n=2 Tax=Pontiella desulfatans TaxID=2750659 RepID=A0A6C2U760_PONDE|nr:hypothetical protein PDESU_04501 [Pontiella desulfatans]